MKTPTHLAHKPIITVDNYNLIDGNHAGFDSDAKALSLGFASYDKQESNGVDKKESNVVAVKFFRKVNNKWSRQSEELPIHRNLDLTILILSIIKNEKITIKGFEKNEVNLTKIDYLKNELNDPIILERIEEIKRLTNL